MINLGTTLTLSTFFLSRLVFRVKKLTVLKSGYFLCYKMEWKKMKGAVSSQCFAIGMRVCIDTEIYVFVHTYKYVSGAFLRIYFCVLLKFTLEPQMLICCNIL